MPEIDRAAEIAMARGCPVRRTGCPVAEYCHPRACRHRREAEAEETSPKREGGTE
jgi:hypothetical protein